MSKMLDRVARAIELFSPSYYVMPAYLNKYNVFKITPAGCVDECMLSLVPQDEAEDECERLNNLELARKAVEALKPVSDEVLEALYENQAGYEGWVELVNAILEK